VYVALTQPPREIEMLPKWQSKNHEALALSVSKLLDERLSLMRDGDVTTAIRAFLTSTE
jgi:hypothetical protein